MELRSLVNLALHREQMESAHPEMAIFVDIVLLEQTPSVDGWKDLQDALIREATKLKQIIRYMDARPKPMQTATPPAANCHTYSSI